MCQNIPRVTVNRASDARFEGDGEVALSAGDSVYQTPGIVHELMSCSDDCELLEITLPADFTTEDA